MKIFVSGFSAVGKSTFVNRIAYELGYQKFDEIIRTRRKTDSQVSQENFYNAYLAFHKNPDLVDFVCDRTIVDCAVWNDIPIKKVQDDLGDSYSKPDLVIIPELPTVTWLYDHHHLFLDDPVRAQAYTDRLGLSKDKVDWTSTVEIKHFIQLVHNTFKRDELKMMQYYRVLDWPVHVASPNYFSWHDTAIGYVLGTLDTNCD